MRLEQPDQRSSITGDGIFSFQSECLVPFRRFGSTGPSSCSCPLRCSPASIRPYSPESPCASSPCTHVMPRARLRFLFCLHAMRYGGSRRQAPCRNEMLLLPFATLSLRMTQLYYKGKIRCTDRGARLRNFDLHPDGQV